MKKTSAAKKKKAHIDKWVLTLPALLLVCIGFYLAYSYMRPAPPDHISIAAGSENGAYMLFAKQYAEYMKKQGITLDIISTKGTVENLGLLSDNSNGIDIAFVQSGVGSKKQYPDLEGVASIYREPLWVFLQKGSNFNLLTDLKGMAIGTGQEGSGSYPATMKILADNGINADNSRIVQAEDTLLVDQLIAGQLDAVMIVASNYSASVKHMLSNPQLVLLDMTRAQAYVRRHPMFSKVLLPRGVISPEKDIPPSDTTLISPVATIVVNKDIHPALISLLLQAADKVHGHASLLDKAGEFPSAQYLDFPVAERAERYFKKGPPFLQRYMPFWAAIMIDRAIIFLLPLVTLLIPLIKIIPPVYRWRVRSRIYSWYEQLLKIEDETEKDLSLSIIDKSLRALDDMEDEVNEIEVPLSYADAKYNLRLHIELVREKLQHKIAQLSE